MLTSHKSAIFECIKNRTNVKKYVIIEIMVSRTHDELKEIQETYKKLYKKELDTDFNSEKNLIYSSLQFSSPQISITFLEIRFLIGYVLTEI
jgi:hypothetical protein